MEMPRLGERLTFPPYGEGSVVFVGAEYFGFRLRGGQDVLIRLDSADRLLASGPEGTFFQESDGAQHFLGSHWEPFFDDSASVMRRLPDILPAVQPVLGCTDGSTSPRGEDPSWVKGVNLVWPTLRHGIGLACVFRDGALHLASIYPFHDAGTRMLLRLARVDVWEGGAEAQVTGDAGPYTLTFFDTRFLTNRMWYEAGRTCAFVLTAIAYAVQPSEAMDLPAKLHPDQVAWQAQVARERGEEPPFAQGTIRLKGMAMLLPIATWDRDDYDFRAPVTSVEEVGEVLGQPAWLVRVALFRVKEGLDKELGILVTRRAWKGEGAPVPGQDIEGQFWLQGYLASPEP